MRSERLAIFIILAFILLIASFNIIGSLTMLIIEKKRDIGILRSLGAGNKLIKRIFLLEGWMISLLGAATGLIMGVFICWLQQEFGLVKLQGDTLIIDSYPVVVKVNDLLMVMATVMLIGYWAAWYPVRYLSRKYLSHT
jgi:lipoprotein-releasing system permease protein